MKNKSTIGKPTHNKTALTMILMFIWVSLIAFAFVAATEPPWIKNLSQFGRTGESEGLKEYGDRYLRQKNYLMAIAQYQWALKIKPDFVPAMVNIAIAYNRTGKIDLALNTLQNAVNIDSIWRGTVFFNTAEVLEGQGRKEEAIEYYFKSLDTEADQQLVLCRLGVLYDQLDQTENARAAFEKALEIQNNPVTPYLDMVKLNLALYENDHENLPILEKMLGDNIDSTKLNDYDLETIKENDADDPTIAKTHNYLGLTYFKLNDIDKAIWHFQQSQQIWPGNVDATKNLQILLKMKNNKVSAQSIK